MATDTPWSSEDRETLLAFLDTETGKRLLSRIANETPDLLPAGDTNAILIRSGEVRALRYLPALLRSYLEPEPVPQKAPEAYPSLDDDSAWEGSKK